MLHVGMDVHWKTTTICILDENGHEVKHQQIRGGWDRVLSVMKQIRQPFQVAFEASCGYGYLHKHLSMLARRVVVAHPGHLRLIFRAKRKNDRVDAQKLAKLLYLDEVPPVYVPSASIQQWREMIEWRQALVAKRVACKNALRALPRSGGIQAPRGLWTGNGRVWLAELALDEMTAWRRDMLLEQLTMLSDQIKRVTQRLDRLADQSAAVTVLRTIPGVGPRTAEAMVAYVADPQRFSDNRSVGTYFGLVPSQDASAGVNRLGHITKQGPGTARKLLVEASWQVIRRCPRTRERFERLCQGRKERRKIALVAIARHLACTMLSMLQTGEAWRKAA